MSLKVYNKLLQELGVKNVEVSAYEYARVFFPNSALANELVAQINAEASKINSNLNLKIKAYVMGKNASLVMIEDLGSLLERSPEIFASVKNIILKYTADIKDGSAKAVLKVKERESPSVPKKETVVVKRPEPKSAPETKPKEAKVEANGKGSVGDIAFDGEKEKYLSSYIAKEEVETGKTLVDHLVENFKIKEDEAKKTIDTWAKRNAGKIEYDANYENGQGLVSKVV